MRMFHPYIVLHRFCTTSLTSILPIGRCTFQKFVDDGALSELLQVNLYFAAQILTFLVNTSDWFNRSVHCKSIHRRQRIHWNQDNSS